ncbi:MAG: hypothetical protein M1834_004204 [Cirrosporium novae-zelandiae]|nr:MAG: hypothetical protein M1834_004204 [Cirrosporium novae-zelandiae]
MSEFESPRTVKRLFIQGKEQRKSLELLPNPSSATYQESLQSAISTFEECQKVTAEISLFSQNEHIEDVSSSDIQYHLIDFYIAELVLKRVGPNRQAILLQAQASYERFLRLLDSYDILSQNDRRLFERFLEDRGGFLLSATSDHTARRNTKITRFKEEQTLKSKLEFLEQNPTALQNDETVLRELYLTEIHLRTNQAFGQLDLISQELQMLASAPSIPSQQQNYGEDDQRRRQQTSQNTYSERLDAPISQLMASGKAGPILDKNGKPLKPFTILDNRAQLRKGVFRPGHNLPTMTIDEYLEEERRRGGIIEGGGEQSGMQPEPDEDNIKKADQETMKAREWDDFKDSHPKGAGNTLNRG